MLIVTGGERMERQYIKRIIDTEVYYAYYLFG